MLPAEDFLKTEFLNKTRADVEKLVKKKECQV